MNKKFQNIHLIIGFGLLFLLPVAKSIDQDFGETSKYLAIGYWGIVSFIFVSVLIRDSFIEHGVKKVLFNIWLFTSLICGVTGALAIIYKGLDDAPWAIWLTIYGVLVGYFNWKKIVL